MNEAYKVEIKKRGLVKCTISAIFKGKTLAEVQTILEGRPHKEQTDKVLITKV